MLRLLLVFWLIQNCAGLKDYPKCCDSDSVLQKVNSSYACTGRASHRIEVLAKSTNFIEEGPGSGECVDVDETVSLFHVQGREVTKEKDLKVSFYSKCCPVDYFYNSTTRGCVKSKKKLPVFFKEKFVKVGLPHCKIIVDINLNSTDLSEALNSSLFLYEKMRDERTSCVDRDEEGVFILRKCENNLTICSQINCVQKCCPDGQSFINGSKCYDTYVHGLDLSSFSTVMDNVNDSFAIIHGFNRGPNTRIYILKSHRTKFHLFKNGTFMQYELEERLEKRIIPKFYAVEEETYCVEHAVKVNDADYYFFRRFPPNQPSILLICTRIAQAISCIFLILTILYYCFSNEKRTVFGKILVSYCLACLVTFFILGYLKFLSVRPEQTLCVTLAFSTFYFIMASFTWMNVMCIDIYLTFGSSRSFSNRQRSKETRRFILYSLYGWCFPLILTVIPLFFYHVPVLPSALEVIVDQLNANKICLIYQVSGNYAAFLFSTTPIAVLELCNFVLFVKTAMYCLKVKKEISKMNDNRTTKDGSFSDYRDRFGLLLKLFVVMGISFLFEVVSTFYDFKLNRVTSIIEITWDTFNSLQGFFIFAIFILKRRIFKKFGKKMGLSRLRKVSLMSSAATHTTSVQTSNSSIK